MVLTPVLDSVCMTLCGVYVVCCVVLCVVCCVLQALFVGLFNFLTTHYMDENSLGELKTFMKSMLFFL
jgi:hypothetical protein